VAIIGAGPSSFYAAGALQGKLKESGLHTTIDMFEKLIAPHGLVRYGVAPDHQKIKSVAKIYESTAANANFRYFGNVEFGKDITHEEIRAHYDAVIYGVGAQSDRNLGVPGENLPNSFSATEFVAWYNGHPEYTKFDPNLSVESAVVVGVGNVAMDVARILAKSTEELKSSDIADHALADLEHSAVKDIFVLSRRGPGQVKFTPVEIKEFGELEIAEPIVLANEMQLDPLSEKLADTDAEMRRNLVTLNAYANRQLQGKQRRVHFRFLLSPVEIVGNDKGEIVAVKCEKNKLVPNEDQSDMKAVGTGEYEMIPAGMVMRSVGYKGLPLPSVPYEKRSGTIPNIMGRVLNEAGQAIVGEYVVGWAKRGPSGVIGTNKPDAVETVNALVADVATLAPATHPSSDAVEQLLKARGVAFVTNAQWQRINNAEIEMGKPQGRPRVKIVSDDDMLKLL
jgi:ferredoxin--NADP+ reductase